MTLARKVVDDAAIGVAISDAREELATINHPSCAAAIWRRQTSPSFREWIDRLAPTELPQTRQVLRPEAVKDAMAAACAERGTPKAAERDWLIDDVASLSTLFAEVIGAPFLRLRLDVVTTNACRKFHIDALTARLICTYRGTGTQYGISTDGGEPERVFTAPTGAPILLRGALWPETPASGLLHRSPPIAGTGETRLLLVLDPIHDPDEEDD